LDPIEARRLVGWDDADLSIAYVGTVGLAQGVGTLIEAVASLRDRGVVLHVVGEGVDRVALERDAGSRSLGNVRFHAPVAAERIPLVLAAADALVVMLKRGVLYDESLPTKLVEALAAGRPIIASASGETARIVLSAQAGFVAPPEDVVGLRNAIVKCLEADDRHAMGTRARTTAIETYDRAVIVNDLATYLSQVAPG
jgi:glycosyltransferase involved in cell wall biosynthesis